MLYFPFNFLLFSRGAYHLTENRGGSRGRVQGVRTPTPPEVTCGFLIQLVFCKKKKLCGLLVLKKSKRRVHPLLKKILDPPLEKSGWDVESIMVSDLPVFRRNTTSVTVWIQKKSEFVLCESGTEKELRTWLMLSNIPFGSYQPEWKDYLKTYSSIFGWNWRLEVTLPCTFHPEFPKFSVKW